MRALVSIGFGLMLVPAVVAQSSAPESVIVPKDTKIEIVALEEVSSKSATVGSPVRFAVLHDVLVDGVKVLYAGAPVNGIITRARPGVPFRQWADLRIRVREVRIGNGVKLRLNHSPPKTGRRAHLDAREVATCALLLPLCIGSFFGMTEDGPEKPDARSGEQGMLSTCEVWSFWVASSTIIPTNDLVLNSVTPSASPNIGCSLIDDNSSSAFVEVQ